MKIEECIKDRRSVRKYTETEITKDTIDEIIDLARFAPSWKNSQAVRYHVVFDKKLKAKIADQGVLGFSYNAKTIERCKALVVVSVLKKVSGYEHDGTFSTPQNDRWEVFDAGIATQTFCLAAHAKGVGSVILGIFDEEKIHQYVSVPEQERVVALIALGYPLESKKAGPPRKDVQELVTYHA
ncbi:nitroreductase family protein [Vallitaleaceae bacterium 9-2]